MTSRFLEERRRDRCAPRERSGLFSEIAVQIRVPSFAKRTERDSAN